MRVLVTGASGFVGQYLTRDLRAHGHDVALMSPTPYRYQDEKGITEALVSDITDLESLKKQVVAQNPDAVVHLAAVSHVVDAHNQREKLSQINVVGTHNLCAATALLDHPVTMLFVSSSLVYSQLGDTDAIFSETTLPQPTTAYGASKLAGEYIVRSFANELFKPYIVRPFNHIGPGQGANFVCPSLAFKVAKAGHGECIKAGNLQAYRDFTHVQDIVQAYRMILEEKPTEDLFVLGSGSVISIQEVLDEFIRLSGKTIGVEIDPSLLRAVDPPRICANPDLAKRILGWSPTISISETLKEIYQEALSKASAI